MRRLALAAVMAGLLIAEPAAAGAAATAGADVFNGRIAFSGFRVQPAPGADPTGDVFTMNPDGSDLRQLTPNPADDAQADWSPDGRAIAYRIRRPDSDANFEVARMSASGSDRQRLTDTPIGEASSQPSWLPDMSAVLFRRSAPGPVAGVWQMGPHGENPAVRFDPPGAQWYPAMSPDMTMVLFATTTSSVGDADRAIQTMNVDGNGLTTLFDVPGAFDSGPAWSPDGARIAFESNANVAGGNPEGDEELWVMDADGSRPAQLTHNALHDEGAAWSPDGGQLVFSSGVYNDHLDITVMTADGVVLRRFTGHEGRDESPDWQAIPAPVTDRRCGDLGARDPGVLDVRAAGRGVGCARALGLAARWARLHRKDPDRRRTSGFRAVVTDFGGTRRVVLRRRGPQVAAFLFEP